MQDHTAKMGTFMCIVICMVLYCAANAHSAPSEKGLQYLERFGYTDNNPQIGKLMTKEDLSSAIMMFQRFAGLTQTGIFDLLTLNKMDQPRCGNPDAAGIKAAARKKRYALQGSKWGKKDLTYKINSHTSDIRKHETEKAIADAFEVWQEESGLTFTKVRTTDKADIEIDFAKGAHGDDYPFDGAGKTLAHAFFPEFGGSAHFDEAEKWAISPSEGGHNLFIVAAHEFGHSLGLKHSNSTDALMTPYYNKSHKGLDKDDIRAIRDLYGSPKDRTRPEIFTTPPIRPPNRQGSTRRTTKTLPVGACNGRFDAITMLENGTTFAFKNKQFWLINDQGMEKGYPQFVRNHWGFSGKVRASLTFGEYTDLFQRSYVRRFKNGIPVNGFPKRISQVYKGIPSGIDAAFVYSGNKEIYFVKGDKYWRFNPKLNKAFGGYPRPLSDWKGLPENLDAALKWKDQTYFFKNGYYWRFDDERVEVAQSLKMPYPRRSDEWWLGCSDNTLKSSPAEMRIGNKEDEDEGGNHVGPKFNARLPHVMASTLVFIVISKLFS